MCFSAEASFAVGGALLPVGGYCIWQAARKLPRLLGLAAVPVFFGIQQISEGFVWLSIQADSAPETQLSALVFLFFGLAFWPFWFPMLATIMETDRTRKWLLAALSLLETGWFWLLFFPLLRDPLLTVVQDHHSIRYEYDGLPIYLYVPKIALRVLYFASLAGPLFLSSEKVGWLPGVLMAASVVVSAVVFDYAFVSVWCFFAAVMSLYICVIFYRLPKGIAQPQAKFGVPVGNPLDIPS